MLLSEIKGPEYDGPILTEGRVDIQVKMILSDVMSKGHVSNGAQVYVITRLMMLLKTGALREIDRYNEVVTPVEMVNYVKTMPSEDLMVLVNAMISTLESVDHGWCCAPAMALPDWIRFVTKAQN